VPPKLIKMKPSVKYFKLINTKLPVKYLSSQKEEIYANGGVKPTIIF
jgi:hypothetical protein